MHFADTKRSVELFYRRWKTSVYTFCLLLTGNEARAEESARKAFLAFTEQESDLNTEEIPPLLLRLAFEATQDSFAPVPLGYRFKVLQYAIFSLPLDQRTAFVIRHVLGLSQEVVAAVLGIDRERAHTLELTGLLRLRGCLPREFFERGRNER